MTEIFHSHLYGQRTGKYKVLAENDVTTTSWNSIQTGSPFYLLIPQDSRLAEEYSAGWPINKIFLINSVGIVTARDKLCIAWTPEEMWERVQHFVSLSVEDAREYYKLGKDAQDWKVENAQNDLIASGPTKQNVVPILYRPFDVRYTYYTGRASGFLCRPRPEVMGNLREGKNLALITSRLTKGEEFAHVQATRVISEVICMSPKTSNNGFVYPLFRGEDNKRNLFSDTDDSKSIISNIDRKYYDYLLSSFPSQHSCNDSVSHDSTFFYIYALLNASSYRSRYSGFLKLDFPRIPSTSDIELFCKLSTYGEALVGLHLMERDAQTTCRFPVAGSNIVEKVTFTEPSSPDDYGQVWVNREQYFEGVPVEVWNFLIGGYQVCNKWLKDRKGRTLSHQELVHYTKIVGVLSETIRLMEEIDETIEEHGGWPLS